MVGLWLPWLLGFRAMGAEPSIARIWNEEILAAIRIDLPHPPVHARNLFHLSAAMYDAWAAYDTNASGYLYRQKHGAADIMAARREAISFAAYWVLAARYSLSRGAATTLPALQARMLSLGYPLDRGTFDTSIPSGLGALIALRYEQYFAADGARQAARYADLPVAEGGYASVNLPLLITVAGTLATNVSRWQPLAITDATTQNGIPVDSIQTFLGAQWKWARPFALTRRDFNEPWIDPGPPPLFEGAGPVSRSEFVSNVVAVLRASSELTPDDGVTIDLSPGAWGNNPLGRNDGQGHPLNPATGQPYAPNMVKRGDFARVLAEFWADGPSSETPPGHWNSLANEASEHPALVRRIGGEGPELDPLEWDVKLYFALNSALHDAACAAWTLKRHYDGWRPITAIRYLAQRGQSSDPAAPSYNPDGLPLVPDLIEVVTAETTAAGGRHQGFPVGWIVVRSWPGQPFSPTTSYSGVRWIAATSWFSYQKKTFITPAFPGYVSGHSTFSRAAAEVLAAFTGSAFFPGGMGTFTARQNQFLTFERGPTTDIQLQWGTYFDAADQAGLSRIWGGIHPPADDFAGRRVGAEVGQRAWVLARQYFDGTVDQRPESAALWLLADGRLQLECETTRGRHYEVRSAGSPDGPFLPEPDGAFQATESPTFRTNAPVEPGRFYRVVRTP